MDIAKLSASVAATGTQQEVGLTVLKKAQQIQKDTATQLIDAAKAPAPAQNLPANLGTRINTSA
jgi:predicted pyridoxine 5'-phosphate oxidase superfamily flavin-nucleotide-binding protein